ncbi:MAG: M12 family metallo-peptidase, partial [Bacteroidota bacterium]
MRKTSTFFLFFCLAFPVLAQVIPVGTLVQQQKQLGFSFSVRQPFSSMAKPADIQNAPVTRADYLSLDPLALQALMQEKPERMELQLPYKGGILSVELVRQTVVAPDFSVVRNDQPGQTVDYTPGLHYRGAIKGNPKTLAAISFFNDEIMGMIAHPEDGTLNLGKLDVPGNTSNYVLFSDRDFTKNISAACGTPDGPITEAVGADDRGINNVNGCVRVYFEADNGLYVNKGSVSATVNYITGFFNSVATLYQNEQISIVISQIYVWATPDDYPSGTSSDALYAFQATRTSFNGDIAHLAAMDPGGLGGIAFLTVLCNPGANYGYSDIDPTYNNFPTYSWTVMVVTHEIGHNLGSNHTQWCGWPIGALDNCYATEGGCAQGPPPTNGGTIMSYCHLVNGVGINFNNGFGPYPGNAVRTGVSGATCLSATCTSNPCAAPSNFSLSGTPTSSGATFTWTAGAGNNTYTLRYRGYNAATWTNITNLTGTSYSLSGLQPGQRYMVELQGVCASGSSDFVTGIFFETVSNCAKPSGQITSNITGNSALLSWTENQNATSWQIKYGSPGFDPLTSGTQITTSTNFYTLSGLSGSTTYQWYVRSVCAPPNSGNSGWTGPSEFTTVITNDNAVDAILLSFDILYDVNNGGTTIQSGEPNPAVSPGRWGNSITNTIWFKFQAPASGTVTINTDFLPQGGNSDTQLALYKVTNASNFSTFSLLISDDDNGTQGNGWNSILYYSGLNEGETYYIQADGYGTNDGSFQIMLTESVTTASLSSTCTGYTLSSVNGTSDPNRWWNIYTNATGIEIGQLVGAIKTSQNLGTVTLKANSSNPGHATGNYYYMGRYYDIQSTVAPNSAVTVRMFYKQSDLTALQSLLGNNNITINDLDALHYDGTNEDCSFSNNGSGTYTAISNAAATQIGSTNGFYLQYSVNSFSELMGVFLNTPLPVELTGFNARAEQKANRIDWQTATEYNVAWHIVHRSPDGASNWTEIGRKIGQVQSTVQRDYQLSDEKPLPTAYYRLWSQNLDGTGHYSPIVRVIRPDAPLYVSALFPSPAQERLFIRFSAAQEESVSLQLYDLTGRLLRTEKVDVRAGMNERAMELNGLPQGMYLIEIQGTAS